MNKLEDTVRACHNSVNIASIYITGWQIKPHYPMPAIPLEAKWFSKDQNKYRTLCIIHRLHMGRWWALTGWWQD